MGWLWSSNNRSEPPNHASSRGEASTDSTSAPSDHGSLSNHTDVDSPVTPNNDPDTEFHALLASLETPSKRNGQTSTSSEAPIPSDSKTITSSTIYPTEMSCRSAFDSAFYCQSLGGQFNNVYRYGTFRDCRDQWKQFWFCMRTNRGFLGDEERGRRIQDHYKLRETKYRVGTSSEDVWKPRTRMVDSAFDGDLEADERAERERIQAETSHHHFHPQLRTAMVNTPPPSPYLYQLSIPSPTTIPVSTASDPNAFPLHPHLWTPGSPTSISQFLSYTRALLHTMTHAPNDLRTRRFEFEAYIFLLHTSAPKFPWFRFAQQVLGSILKSNDPGELDSKVKNTWSERLQFACGDLMVKQGHCALRPYGGVGEVKTIMSDKLGEAMGRVMTTWFGAGGDGKERIVTQEMVERCEGWIHAVIAGIAQHLCQMGRGNGNGNGHGHENGVQMVMGYPTPHLENAQMHNGGY